MTGRRLADRSVILVLWLLVFVAGSQALIVAPILPRIAEQLAVETALLGTLITAYAVTVGLFALVSGPISDSIGRRRILLLGTGLMAAALFLHWLAWDFATLLLVRALAGIAGGVLNGAAVAYVGDYFPAERRGWANGWVFSGFAAGQIAGIPIGAVLAERFGFRIPFVLFAALMVVTLALVWVLVPQPDVERAAGRLTVRGALGGYAALLSRPEIAAATVIFVVMFGGNALYMTYLPTWLETTLGVGAAAVGGMFLVGGIANVLAAPRAGTLSDRVGRKRVVVAASAGLAVVMLLTAPLVASLGILAAYGVFFVVMGLFAARATPFMTLLVELVDADRRGSLMSLTVGLGQIGSGLGGAVAGAAYVGVGYGGSTAIAAAAMVVILLLVWRFLPETIVPAGEDPIPARPAVPPGTGPVPPAPAAGSSGPGSPALGTSAAGGPDEECTTADD